MKYVSSTRIPIALRSVKLQKVVCGANFQMVIRRSDAPESQIRAKDQNTVSHHPLEREGVLFVEAQDAIQRLDADVVPVEALKIGYQRFRQKRWPRRAASEALSSSSFFSRINFIIFITFISKKYDDNHHHLYIW